MLAQIDCIEDVVCSCTDRTEVVRYPILVMVGLNYRTASIALREKLAIDSQQMPMLLQDLCSHEHVQEALIPSTSALYLVSSNRLLFEPCTAS